MFGQGTGGHDESTTKPRAGRGETSWQYFISHRVKTNARKTGVGQQKMTVSLLLNSAVDILKMDVMRGGYKNKRVTLGDSRAMAANFTALKRIYRT
ncbi:hypothetical protein [Candidatus Symbiopectobacterium sp. PLON1]|uniref:hypothetical protein n=1 Tax=Candidatus Symbiopectobacterium sp. PLON1 TaxID=2794575 RepID=UPI001A2600EF|nr:hypothetical protein [Candidatus Symbiopectobacterium sp. PLON1]MBG6247327.1 hypothetical protein [Candidatus Symbiopectobacterium sp. PLON1]